MGIFEYSTPQLHNTVFSPTAIYFNTNVGTADSSGNGKTLTEDLPFTSLSSSEPYVSRIRSFSGGRYSISDTDFRSVGSLSISCMMKITGSRTESVGDAKESYICGYGGPIGDVDGTENIVYQYYFNENNNLVSFREYGAGSNEEIIGDFTMPLDEWFHFGLTRSSDGLTELFYINGRQIDTQIFTNAPTGGTHINALFVLAQGFGTNHTNYHQMSSFAIYVGVTLSEDQIQYLARRCLGR